MAHAAPLYVFRIRYAIFIHSSIGNDPRSGRPIRRQQCAQSFLKIHASYSYNWQNRENKHCLSLSQMPTLTCPRSFNSARVSRQWTLHSVFAVVAAAAADGLTMARETRRKPFSVLLSNLFFPHQAIPEKRIELLWQSVLPLPPKIVSFPWLPIILSFPLFPKIRSCRFKVSNTRPRGLDQTPRG